jgi:hypothetical protein
MHKIKRTKNTMIYKTLHKTKDRATRTALTTKGELSSNGRVTGSCSKRDTRRV